MESTNVTNEGTQEIQSTVASASRPRKKYSKVWRDFDLVEDPNKKVKAICKHCGTEYDARSTNGTTNMRRHLLVCSKYTPESHVILDQKVYRDLVCKAIIKHGYPFTWVEHEGNRDIHSYLNNTVESVTRNTIKTDCMKLHKKLKECLQSDLNKLSSRICLTSDMWTSCTNRGFLCLTAHYVDDDWKLQSKILNFHHVPPPHTAIVLCNVIHRLLREWGIEKKIFSITLDNARAMDNMQDFLRNKLVQHDNLLCRGAFFHIRCCAHILNLIVQDGLKSLGTSLEKVRYGVKYVEGSESRMIKFKDCAKQANLDYTRGLWLDVPTRWNSTYMMLDRYIYYYNAFVILPSEDTNFRHEDLPTEEEFNRFQEICKFLKPFYEITNLFSGKNYPTANLYFENVCNVRSNIIMAMESSNNSLQVMAQAMHLKFSKYWDDYSMVLAFAVILDPRFKLKFVKFCLKKFDSEFEDKTKNILDQLKKLFREYEKRRGLNARVDVGNTSQIVELNQTWKVSVT